MTATLNDHSAKVLDQHNVIVILIYLPVEESLTICGNGKCWRGKRCPAFFQTEMRYHLLGGKVEKFDGCGWDGIEIQEADTLFQHGPVAPSSFVEDAAFRSAFHWHFPDTRLTFGIVNELSVGGFKGLIPAVLRHLYCLAGVMKMFNIWSIFLFFPDAAFVP
jgi:hypothetical protein